MLKDTSPQFTYYVMLYALTVVLRGIRAYNSRPTEPATKAAKTYWVNYLFFGFELVNVSAGVFILLTQSAANYVGTIMMLYVILVVVSFFLEGSNVGRMVKTLGHIAVTAVIFAVTLFAFLGYDGLRPSAQPQYQASENLQRPWRVALSYMDTGLNRYHGTKIDPIVSAYVTQVNASSREEAVEAARRAFQAESGPAPFQPKMGKTPLSMVVINEDIVAEALPLPKVHKP